MSSRPWHKRWHGSALNGMRGLSLELRGAYQTLLDLMYDNGGPVRLDERRQSAEMDCDIRVFRRVVGALIEAEKIHLWCDGRSVYIVNEKVQVVLGGEPFAAATSALLPAEVREKFSIANAELTPKSGKRPNQNNNVLEKNPGKAASRREKREEDKNAISDEIACAIDDEEALGLPPSKPNAADPPKVPVVVKSSPPRFAEWWLAYPKKVAKPAAEKSYNRARAKIGGPDPDAVLMDGLERSKRSRSWRDGYIHNPTTWLNQGHWTNEESDDAPQPTRSLAAPGGGGGPQARAGQMLDGLAILADRARGRS